jgi:hypothetical protein
MCNAIMLTLHPKAQGVQNLDPAGSATGRQWWFANRTAIDAPSGMK